MCTMFVPPKKHQKTIALSSVFLEQDFVKCPEGSPIKDHPWWLKTFKAIAELVDKPRLKGAWGSNYHICRLLCESTTNGTVSRETYKITCFNKNLCQVTASIHSSSGDETRPASQGFLQVKVMWLLSNDPATRISWKHHFSQVRNNYHVSFISLNSWTFETPHTITARSIAPMIGLRKRLIRKQLMIQLSGGRLAF